MGEFWDNRPGALNPIDDLRRLIIAAPPGASMAQVIGMPEWGLRPPAMEIVSPQEYQCRMELVTPETLKRNAPHNAELLELAAANAFNTGLCPNCGKSLASDEVYRTGYDWDNYRTIPATIGRGKYCDHVKAIKWSDSESISDWSLGNAANSIETQPKPTALRNTIAASLICWLIIGAIFAILLIWLK